MTVNLGGTVFNIDDDAYRLLDNYLNNLKHHFRKEAGADEIVDDIERRISELFIERCSAGRQVITLADVEAVKQIVQYKLQASQWVVDNDYYRIVFE